MFDSHTAQLIRRAPPLSQLDMERLPQRLTRAFTTIVAFRVRMSQAGAELPAELLKELDVFRRMANTFESLVVLLPTRENREAAAYVAAQAHHLVFMARALAQSEPIADRHLRAEAISPAVSALLLFLIADQQSDAMELAKTIRAVAAESTVIERSLIEALALLAEGRPQAILDIPMPELLQQEDVEDEAVQALFLRLFQGVRLLGDRLSSGAEGAIRAETPDRIFRQVQELAVEEVEQAPQSLFPENANFRALTTYPGPHQLAVLLVPAAARLEECATANLQTPPGANAAEWVELRSAVVRERPFLWRNHRDAITQGFLDLGTSAVVSFPTGAGKTTLSELKAASALSAGGAVLYLAPTHALVSQLKRSLQKTFPRIVVGDSLVAEDFYVEVGEDKLCEIAVMTPERCLALLSITPQMFQRVRVVIFDECHLLHPQASGRTGRSVDAMLAMLHLARVAPETDWLLLSAMMSNADELAGWLGELTGRRCLALKLDWKPTRQARGCLVFEQKELDRLNRLVETEQAKTTKANPPQQVQSLFQAKPYGFFCLDQTWQSTKVRDYTLQPLLEELVSFSVSKAAGKTRWQLNPNKTEIAAHLAARCAQRGLRVLLFGQTIPITANLAQLVEERLQPIMQSAALLEDEANLQHWATIEVGTTEALYCCPHHLAGCHHGDMLPVERELVERLFRRPDGIRALAATTTLAQGVNLPADIVFIVGDARWDATGKKSKMLEAHELLNAAGRAGRAGQVAQGLVVVLPNFLVGFDPKPKIGRGWSELRTGIFSKPDQCLRILDPVQMILDLLQDPNRRDNPEVRYFLRRLPVPTLEDADAPAKFLRSSLAAYHARQAKTEAAFEQKVQAALASRDAALKEPEGTEWQVELACRSGVSSELIVELDRDLRALDNNRPTDTESWLRWFCDWLGESPARRKSLLRHDPAPVSKETQQLDLFGDKLFQVVWAWMSGAPLSDLAVMLGAKKQNLGKCSVARHFALRRIPEIAYAIGLVTHVFREHLDRGLTAGKMPIVLATISLCVRAGQSSPEELAVRFETHEPQAARKCVRALWIECSRYIKPGSPVESFAGTRDRVAAALSQIAPPSLFSRVLAKINPETREMGDEMPWDTAAREAVEWALENANWDAVTGTITFYDPDDSRIKCAVSSREELEEHLRSIAGDAFSANCSRDEGEFCSECDEDSIVEDALTNYETRLETFFAKKGQSGAQSC